MATDNPDTGSGATVALTTATFTASIVDVGALRAVLESLDTTDLGDASSAYAKKMIGDNPDLSDVPVTYQFKAEEAAPIPGANATDTLTITLPISNSSNTTAMSVVLSGFVKENDLMPGLARNQVNTGVMTFTPNGETVTITVET